MGDIDEVWSLAAHRQHHDHLGGWDASESYLSSPTGSYKPWCVIPGMGAKVPRMTFSDNEALLSEPAAALYDDMWRAVPWLYARGVVFHPETLLRAQLTTLAPLRVVYDASMLLLRCDAHKGCTRWGFLKAEGR